jgi:hydrogenase maturation protein HypF
MKRVGHLKSVEMTGGDAMAKNADIPAMCYLYEAEQNGYLNLRENPYRAAQKADVILASLDNHINTIKNSSAGRLFDAVAAVLDLCHENSYEGECPNVLQTAAERFEGKLHMKIELPIRIVDGNHIADTPYLIKEILREKQNGTPVEELAYAFHVSLAEATSKIIQEVCRRENVTQVALSGGTFYNRLLLGEVFKKLEKTDTKLYINEQVPGGDGGLALGQLFLTL